jgi:hypothetical protein
MQHDLDREAQKAAEALTLWQKTVMQERGIKVYLGHEQREGWSGKLPFYLFCCEACGSWAKDYPHGYIERRYLNCSSCKAYHSFVPWWAVLDTLWRNISSRFGRGQ